MTTKNRTSARQAAHEEFVAGIRKCLQGDRIGGMAMAREAARQLREPLYNPEDALERAEQLRDCLDELDGVRPEQLDRDLQQAQEALAGLDEQIAELVSKRRAKGAEIERATDTKVRRRQLLDKVRFLARRPTTGQVFADRVRRYREAAVSERQAASEL